MSVTDRLITRRDFVKGLGGTALGLAAGVPLLATESQPRRPSEPPRSRVVLVRDEDAVAADGTVNADVVGRMLDSGVRTLCDEADAGLAWTRFIGPDDIVGIKSNEWPHLPTPKALEEAIVRRVRDVGVSADHIAVDDRGVLQNPVFRQATALINARPMRTHAWSGVGSLLKNYIMFTPQPPEYHANSCANLGALWHLPAVAGKTRLNILVMLTPLFYGRGWHHFDPEYVWPYGGLLIGTDPVATDSVGLRILEAKRRAYLGEERPIMPPPHHIRFADTRHGLGQSDPGRIDLVKVGWSEGALI